MFTGSDRPGYARRDFVVMGALAALFGGLGVPALARIREADARTTARTTSAASASRSINMPTPTRTSYHTATASRHR